MSLQDHMTDKTGISYILFYRLYFSTVRFSKKFFIKYLSCLSYSGKSTSNYYKTDHKTKYKTKQDRLAFSAEEASNFVKMCQLLCT
jgi:hypothetical protein